MTWSGLPENIEARIMPEPNSGCWLWLGAWRDKEQGYGGVKYQGKMQRAHRFVFEFFNGPLPKNLTVDHLCRNRICCNPEHLEAATWAINIQRGEGVAPKNTRKTHCPQGHEYTLENTYIWKDQRFCRACHQTYSSAYSKRKQRAQEPTR